MKQSFFALQMKKFPPVLKFRRAGILPIILAISFLFFLPQKTNAQIEQDCRKIFDKESYKCLGVSGDCQRKCGEETKRPDGGAYFNSGEVYSKCTKANDCDGKGQACNEQALANFRACGKPGKESEAKAVKKDGPSWLEFLGINPYQTWLRLNELVEVTKFYASGDLEDSVGEGFLNLFDRKSIRQKDEETVKAKEQAFEAVFGKDWREQLNQAKIDSKTEENAWEIPVPKQESVTDVPGTTDTKRYSWDTNSGVVIKSNDWEKIEFKQPVKAAGGETIRTIKLDEGEIEVKVRNNNPAENQFGVDAGWLGVTVSRTHFWVLKDRTNKSTVVGVYEGEVEVKTRDGHMIKIKPDGDKPGVVVVTQKLSVIKLAILGAVMAAIVGGVFWFIKGRKLKSSKKR